MTKNTFFDNLYPYTLSKLPAIMAVDFNVVDQPTDVHQETTQKKQSADIFMQFARSNGCLP